VSLVLYGKINLWHHHFSNCPSALPLPSEPTDGQLKTGMNVVTLQVIATSYSFNFLPQILKKCYLWVATDFCTDAICVKMV
jgi:hypothetical protein